LFMTNTQCRTLFGNTTYNRASRFLREVPAELIENLNKIETKNTNNINNIRNTNNEKNSIFENKGLNTNFEGLKPFKLMYGSEMVKVGTDESYAVGENVEHKKFGIGVITKAEKDGSDFKLEIQFQNSGMKRLMAAFANLKKLE
jgi:DNA helicase II / ATP-dependent DNA helicase PcrA